MLVAAAPGEEQRAGAGEGETPGKGRAAASELPLTFLTPSSATPSSTTSPARAGRAQPVLNRQEQAWRCPVFLLSILLPTSPGQPLPPMDIPAQDILQGWDQTCRTQGGHSPAPSAGFLSIHRRVTPQPHREGGTCVPPAPQPRRCFPGKNNRFW